MDDSPNELHIDEGQDSNTPMNSTPFSYTARDRAYYSSTSTNTGNALVQHDTTATSSPHFDSIYSHPYSSVSASNMWSGGEHIPPPEFSHNFSGNFYDGATHSYQSRAGYLVNQQQFAQGFHHSNSRTTTAEGNYPSSLTSSRKLIKMAAPYKNSSKKKTKNNLNQSLHYPFQTNSFSSSRMANSKR